MHPTIITSPDPASEPADLASLITTRLREFAVTKAALLAEISARLGPFGSSLTEISGQGSARPVSAFCYWGWRAAGGDAGDERIVTAATALELMHAGALIHDDQLTSGAADPAAILLGDLHLTWCAEMFYGCGLPARRLSVAARPFHLMHAEVLAGIYLGLVERAPDAEAAELARLVVRCKSAGFSAQRPMQVGAALAGAGQELLGQYGAFALALGEAVRLRSEVLGVFGDGAGRPAADNLRLGKAAILTALARQRGNPGQRAEIQALYGDRELSEDGADRLRAIITDTRALAATEELIVRRANEALGAIHRLPAGQDVKEALTGLAVATADGTA